MLKLLTGIKEEPTSGILLAESGMVVNDLSSNMPTHVLAIYVPPETPCRSSPP